MTERSILKLNLRPATSQSTLTQKQIVLVPKKTTSFATEEYTERNIISDKNFVIAEGVLAKNSKLASNLSTVDGINIFSNNSINNDAITNGKIQEIANTKAPSKKHFLAMRNTINYYS